VADLKEPRLIMSRRTEKVASVIRQVLSQGIATKLSDPRITSFASITRVEVSGDLMHASVYVSVMGSEADERKALAGLDHARGFLQSMLARKLTTRHCPQLRFVVDKGIKKQMETLALIDQISAELRESEAASPTPPEVVGEWPSDIEPSRASDDGAEVSGDAEDIGTSPGECL
jgi:ribosome-binding factor A